MSVLAEILSSRVRAEVFRLLFDSDEKELYLREIGRVSGFAIGTVQTELKKLIRLELVVNRRDGNRLYYRANPAHPLYPVLSELVAKTVGFTSILKQVLSVDDIELAFVFGSLATDTEQAESDLDLFIIGDITLRRFSSLISGLEEKIGREINPHIFSRSELRKRRTAGDHFITTVLAEEKTFIIGSEDELDAI